MFRNAASFLPRPRRSYVEQAGVALIAAKAGATVLGTRKAALFRNIKSSAVSPSQRHIILHERSSSEAMSTCRQAVRLGSTPTVLRNDHIQAPLPGQLLGAGAVDVTGQVAIFPEGVGDVVGAELDLA